LKERALLFGKVRNLVGVLTYLDNSTRSHNSNIGILLLNAGLIHHVGPGRIYVKIARKLAALGFLVMRFDMSGIGDSNVRSDQISQEEAVVSDTREAMDYLQHNYSVNQFVLIGICSGASAAFITTENDPRIIKSVLINPLAPNSERTNQMRAYDYYSKQATSNMLSWLKLFSFRVDFKMIWESIMFEIKRRFIPGYVQGSETIEVIERLRHAFKVFDSRKTKLLIVSSESEIGNKYLKELLGSQFLAMEKTGLIRSQFMADTDHNVTPISGQDKLIKLISNWIQEEDGINKERTIATIHTITSHDQI